jgi:hypothetical protein
VEALVDEDDDEEGAPVICIGGDTFLNGGGDVEDLFGALASLGIDVNVDTGDFNSFCVAAWSIAIACASASALASASNTATARFSTAVVVFSDVTA